MKIQIELCSIEELAAICALIRQEPVDPEAIAALTKRLADSAGMLQVAENAVPPQP